MAFLAVLGGGMTSDHTDKLRRAFARLSALKENLPAGLVSESFVTEYHEALQHVENCGFDVTEFKIQPSHVNPRVTSFNYLSGRKTYSDTRYVDRNFLLTKLSAVLSFFQMTLDSQDDAPAPQSIGFRGNPSNK